MFLKSLQWRLVIIFVLIATSLIIFVGVFLNRSVESSYYSAFKENIESGFANWSELKGRDTRNMPDVGVNELLAELRDNRDARNFFSIIGNNRSYTVIQRDSNEIIYSSDKRYNQNKDKFLLDILKSENLITALNGKSGNKNKLTRSGGNTFFDYAEPIKLKEGGFVLYFKYDSEDWSGIITNFNEIIMTSFVIAFILSLALGYVLSITITVPIVRIMHKAREIATGDFDKMLEVKSDDEIGELTNTFNYMATELKNTMNEISSEKNKIETILNYMTDGVIAFNLKGEVIHANPAARRMLGVDEFSDNFDSFTKKCDMAMGVEDVLYLDSAVSKEKSIHLNDIYVRVYFALFTDEEKKAEGIIAVLQDITEQQKLENMRKEFVANVSHELRTPLTSIKSYTETLMDGAMEDSETAGKFLRVINSEADRMTRLVKDLLQLSRLDNQKMKWKMQEIPFVILVKSVVEKMQMEAKNKNQQLESHVIDDIPEIRADHDRMEQVLINLLSNAVKYTPEGGKINVFIGRTQQEAYVKVVDNGIGIPAEDLPRIFERFYRVDKARSREMGGTGLGLSIAREIVEAHGGTISVSSEYGKGTEVMVKLPICN